MHQFCFNLFCFKFCFCSTFIVAFLPKHMPVVSLRCFQNFLFLVWRFLLSLDANYVETVPLKLEKSVELVLFFYYFN